MRIVGAAIAVTLASVAQLTACTSGKVSSIDSKKTLSSLTPEDQRRYCEDRSEYLSSRVSQDDRKKIKCAAAATVAGTGGEAATDKEQSACQQVYDACMTATVPALEAQRTCDGFSESVRSCTATVGEVDACTQAQADALEKLASSADKVCTEQGRSRSDRDQISKATEACSRVHLLCPQVFEEPALRKTETPAQGVPTQP